MTTLNACRFSIHSELKAFLQLAIPLASAQVAQLATGFVDTVMMGHLGRDTLAAGALASITFFSIVWTASGVVMGVSPLVAEAYGAGKKTRIEQVARQGLWLSLLLAIPIMVAIAHLEPLLHRLGQPPTTVKLTKEYLDIVLWGLFPALGFAMLRGVVSALSQARPIVGIVVAGTGFNILSNYVLGFGKFGFPRLELTGLALASALTLWGMFGVLVLYLLISKQFKAYRFFSRLHQIKPQVLWQLVKLGVPIGVFSALEIGVYTAVSYLMGTWGTDSLAAHQIVFQTINLIFMVPLGMSFAATARIGQWLGQRQMAEVRQASFVSLAAGATWTAMVAIALLVFPRQIIGLYIDSAAPENTVTVALAVAMMRVGAIAHLFDGVQKIAYGALQGLQDTRVPLVFSFLSYWCIGLTSGYWLAFGWNLGGVGLWLGLLIAVAIAAAVLIWRLQMLTSVQTKVKLFN
ncbi:MAG: MATE family efflux transporter [Synechococcales bacterium]|nr:MATE family efflux transporter [Synechococcales bacterium]